MKIQDLRIGNLVKWDINQDCVVEGIIAYQMTKDTAHLKGLRDGKEFIVNASIGSIEGMPIDEEYLLKNGFKMVDDCYGFNSEDLRTSFVLSPMPDGYFYPQICQEAELSLDTEQTIFLCRIQYIHELQNLVYTLFKIEI